MPRKSSPKTNTREIVHPKPRVQLCIGDKALIEKQAMKLLGWTVLKDGDQSEYDFKDLEGNRIRCDNNLNNRPFDFIWCKTLAQELLRGRWRFNFENIIVGVTGLLLSGQHRLIALVFACQLYRMEKEAYPFWSALDTEPRIQTSIGYGCPEDDETVNTMDTAKPRTASDVLYRSPFFQKLDRGDRKTASKMLAWSIKHLWNRTGVPGAFDLKRTHAETLGFLDRHSTLLECTNHILVENEDKSLSDYVSPGLAVSLMYLMATSKTNPDKYLDMDEPDESVLDVSRLEKAEKFWTLLSQGEEFEVVRKVLQSYIDAEDLVGNLSAFKEAVIIKAWNLYITPKAKLTPAGLKLKTAVEEDSEDELRYLDEAPLLGGIDFGGEREDNSEDEEENEELQQELEEETTTPRKRRAKKVKVGDLEVGTKITVKDADVEWTGTVTELEPQLKAEPDKGFAGAGKSFEVNVENVTLQA